MIEISFKTGQEKLIDYQVNLPIGQKMRFRFEQRDADARQVKGDEDAFQDTSDDEVSG